MSSSLHYEYGRVCVFLADMDERVPVYITYNVVDFCHVSISESSNYFVSAY